jgi:hypothetical protein
MKGIKHDNGKPRLAEMIIDFKEPLQELCKVWEFGANKYSKSNWKEVENGETRYINALIRHLLASIENEYDDESGLPHYAHLMFNAVAYAYFVERRLKNDNI